jgi:allophanate hydrolase subunit 2
VFGSIQVPSGGVPIILMADHQTAGGYAKIGTVLSFDLPKLAQARPGDTVHFVRISAEDAQKLY